MRKTFYGALALMLMTAGAQAQVTRSGAGYLMRVKYAKGQVMRLNTTNTVSGIASTGAAQGGKTQFKTPVTLTVLDVNKGQATLRLKMDPVTYGSSVINPGQTAVVKLDTRNRPVGNGVPSGVGAALPDKPIRIGQTWKGEVPVSSQMASGKLSAVYKLQGVKAINGKLLAVITYTVTGLASGTGTMTLLAKDGTLESNQMKLTLKMGQSPLTLISSMVRS